MKQKVVYIGTSHTIIEKIVSHPSFDLQQIICESKRIKDIHVATSKSFGLPLIPFTNKAHFVELIQSIENQELVFIIYQLDMIVPESLTSKYRFFNLHAGNIATNRGAHPIIRSVLNGDAETELTFHEIDAKIDQGTIVATYPVAVSNEDNPITIKSKMESGIPTLLDSLESYLKGKVSGTKANGGTYYKPISELDFTIDLITDSKEAIQNKIRSQVQYFGAVVYHENQKYNVKELSNWQESQNSEETITITEEVIKVKRTSASFELKINKR